MKRFISLLLALTMVLSVAPVEVFALSDESVSEPVQTEPAQTEPVEDSPGEEEPAEPSAPEFWGDVLPPVSEETVIPEFTAPEQFYFGGFESPSRAVMLPIDTGIGTMSTEIARQTYYAPAGVTNAVIGYISLPDEYNFNDVAKIFAVDSNGVVVATTSSVEWVYGNSATPRLYFTRKTRVGEEFSLRVYGGTLLEPRAYIIGTLKITDLPIIKSLYFVDNFNASLTSYDIAIGFDNFEGDPATGYRVSLIDSETLAEVASTDNGGGFRYINSNYGGDITLRYNVVRTAELDPAKQYSVKVERTDGGLLYSAIGAADYSPYSAALRAGITPAADGPVTISSVTVDSPNSSLIIKLENYTAGAAYTVSVSASMLGLTSSGSYTPDSNGAIIVPMTWAGDKVGLAEADTYYITIYGSTGVLATYTKSPDVAATGPYQLSYNAYLYKSYSDSDGEYTVILQGGSNAMKAVYEAQDPVITVKRIVSDTDSGSIISAEVIGSFTVTEKNITSMTDYAGNAYDTYYMAGHLSIGRDLDPEDTAYYGLYFENKLVCPAFLQQAVSTEPTMQMIVNNVAFTTGNRYYVNDSNGIQRYKNVFWFVLDQLGLSFTTTYGGKDVTVNVRSSDGNIVMSAKSTGKADSQYAGSYESYVHTVYFDSSAASKLVSGEYYSFEVTDGSKTVTIMEDAEYSTDKILPNSMSLSGYGYAIDEGLSEIAVYGLSSSNSYYMFGQHSGIRNYTCADLEAMHGTFVRIVDNETVNASVIIKKDENGRNVPYIRTDKPLEFGEYNYFWGIGQGTVTVCSGKTYISNSVFNNVGDSYTAVTLAGNINLPDGDYTAYLCNGSNFSYEKVSMTRSGSDLSFTVPVSMRQNNLNILVAVFCNGRLVGTTSFYYYSSSATQPNNPLLNAVPVSIGVYDPDTHIGYQRGLGMSITYTADVMFSLMADRSIAEYRFADDRASLDTARYNRLETASINDFGDIYNGIGFEYTFKNANGWNNVYFQFRYTDGRETVVVPYSVFVTDIPSEPKITSAKISDGYIDENNELIIRSSNDFIPVEIHSNSKMLLSSLNTLRAVFDDGNGGEQQISLSAARGELKKCTQHSDCYTVTLSFQAYSLVNSTIYGELKAIRIQYNYSMGEFTNYDIPAKLAESELPKESKYIAFTNLDNYYSTKYVNDSFVFEGAGAIPNSVVTAVFTPRDGDSITITANADSDGTFEMKVTESFKENTVYSINLSCALGEETRGQTSNSYSISVDRTAPVLSDCGAVKNGESGEDGAIISWKSYDANICFITLKRIDNGVEKVLISRERVYDSSYIDTAPVADTTKYSIFAEDAAGNKSAEITFAFVDVVPPEAPANLRTVSAYTAAVTIEWDAAKDNVGIGKYYIYRRLGSENNYTQIGEVDGETLRYTDTDGLKESTQYYYQVSAEDTSGNESAQSKQTGAKTGSYWLVDNYTKWTPNAYITEADKLTVQGTVRLASSGLSDGYEFDRTQVFMRVSPGADGEYEEKELSVVSGSPDTRDFSFDFTGYEAGEYQIVFRAIDVYGIEKETLPRTFTLSEDTSAPAMSLSGYPSTVGPNTKFTMNVSLSDNVMLKDFTVTAKINGAGDDIDVFRTEFTQKDARNTLEIEMQLFAEKGIKLNTGDVVVLHFVVRDTSDNEKSGEISLKINATAPGKVSGVSISPSSSDICLKWPHSSGMEPGYYYKIYRSVSPDGGFEFIGQTGMYLTQYMLTNYYIDSSIEEPGTYYYYVTAYGEYDNESGPSEIVSGMCCADKESPKIVSFAPAEGITARKTLVLSASATDNYKLASVIFDYQKVGDSNWKHASDEIVIPEEERGESYSFVYSWDISALETGEYNVRVSVYDQSNKDEHYYGGSKNAPATEVHKISVIKYDPPAKPTVSVETTNSTATLSWIYTGELGAVEKFEISCCETDNGEFRLIKTVSPETFSYTLDLDSTMYYRVAALDSLGGKGISDAVAAIPKPNDTEKPVAVITPEEIVGAVGDAISLSAESSSDNTGIVSYSWTFGDGETASGATVTHTYSAADNYNIVLTVTDAAGNESKDFVTADIVDVNAPGSEYVKVNLTVVDGAVGASATVPGATLLFYSNEGVSAGRTYVTDENGRVSVVLKKAAYTVNCVADGYSPATKTLDLTPCSGTLDQLFAISSGALVTGSLSSEPMTKEEIIQAGIDYNDPSNQQIEKFKVELRFDESFDLKYEILLGYKNKYTGEFIRAEGGFHEMPGSGSGKVGSMKFGAFPISEHFLLVIYGEAHWLKEMYKTQLFVFNANTVEHLENIKAELVLPKGLSLATMATGVQSAEQTLDRMDTMNGSVFTWYVRGDVAGDYYLTANVNAVSVEGALSTDISETYKTSSPIHVYAGNALKMTIHAPNIAKREEVYSVVFDLENVSDKPIYDFVFSISSVEQHKIITSNGITIGDILLDSTDHSLNVPISVFEPGGKISVSVNSTIMFNGTNELIRLNPVSTFVDPAYVLTDVSKVTLEGSTTSIPYVVNIEKVEKTGFLEGTPFEGLINFFGIEDVRGYKPEFDPKDMAIELLGWVLDVPMLSETITMMSLMETEGEYSYEVSIENGKVGANTVTDNVIEIESADTANSYVDAASGSLKLTGGDVMLKALKEGKTNVTITVVPTAEGEKPRTYELAITVVNGEVKAEIVTGSSGIAAVANRAADSTAFADHTAAVEALEELTQKTRAEMKKNPYEWFNSVYALNSGAADAHVGLRAEDLKNAADRAFITHIGIESENAEILLDRGVIDRLVGSDMAVDSVKLSAAEAEERFGAAYKDCPTYEFTLTSGSSEVKELGGKATVSVPYTFKEGETENSIVVQHIDDQGNAEQIDFIYKDGRVVFETESFSCFRILNVGDMLPDSELVISGSTYLGGVLTASVEGVKEGELIYKWYRGGNFDAPIAVGASYTVTEADSEQKLTVRAYGTGDPYAEDLYLSAEIEIPDLEKTYIKGDVNNDGAVNVLDVVLLADYCTNGNSSEGMDVFVEPAAYVNGDGNIDVLDVIALIDLISNE